MRKLRALWLRLRGVFPSAKAERELAAELESHLAMHTEDGVRSGLSPAEARRQALIRLGGLEQTKIAHRERRGLPLVETLVRDLVYGLRVLRKNPGFALISIMVIAIGIGANVALFTVVRSVLLRPLPFYQPDRLIGLYGVDEPEEISSGNMVAAGDFYDWQKAAHSFSGMAIWRVTGFNMSGSHGELPEFLDAGAGSANFLPLLGVQPALGRWFSPDEDQHDAKPVTVLNWNFFERRFGGDPAILGKTIKLNARLYTVIGVLPRWFAYPDSVTQLWVPFRFDVAPERAASHYAHQMHAIGRLKPNVTIEAANSELSGIQHQIFVRWGSGGSVRKLVESQPILTDVVGEVRTPLYVLTGAVSCLLLIACLNLANLLVARGAARRREIAIRSALGSSRLRLCREQMAESILICIAGGITGAALAILATRWLTTHWLDMPRAESVHPDGAVAAFAIAITLFTGVLSGLLPALSATGKGMLSALQDNSRAVSAGTSRTTLRKTLLTTEIALTVILLVCSGLLVKSFLRLRSVDIGCATKNVLTMNFFLRSDHYSHPEQIVSLYTQLVERVRQLPGVEAAGLGDVVPADGYYGDTEISIPEHPAPKPGEHSFVLYRTADPGFFTALAIPLVRGRFFTGNERLSNDKYLIVNRQLVRDYFPGEDPIGKHVNASWGGATQSFEIIGVVGDTPFQLNQPVRPAVWFPILSGTPGGSSDAVLVVRSRRDVTALALPIQKILAQLDPDLPMSKILTMEQIIGESTATSSFSATLMLVFAGISLLLAAVGIYGVLAYLVTQRTTEIGIRMALGAQREQVMRLVLFDGLRPALLGLALGLAGSAAATQLLRSALYATRPLDASVFVSVIVTLLLAAAAACLVPAWRATRVDPMQALRAD